MNPEDERITAFDTLLRHPFFNMAFEDDNARPLIDSMIELLDEAVSPRNEGEKMSDIITLDDKDETLYVYTARPDTYGKNKIIVNVTGGNGVILTLKDVAALHKALGDHLEANRKQLPRSGAVQFAGGQIAVWRDDIAGWSVTSSNRAWGTEAELEHAFGTDWVELVPKDA